MIKHHLLLACYLASTLCLVQTFNLKQTLFQNEDIQLKAAPVPTYVTPPVIEPQTACNYETVASTFYHLNDIVKKDGSGAEQTTTQHSKSGAATVHFGFCQQGIDQSYPITHANYTDTSASPAISVNFTKQAVDDIPVRSWDNHIRGFHMNFTSRRICPASGNAYQLTVTAFCDTNKTELTPTGSDFTDACHPKLEYHAPQACPLYEVSYLDLLLAPYTVIIGALLGLVGAYLLIFGHANLPMTIFLSTFPIHIFGIAEVFFGLFTAQQGEKWANWLILFVVLLIAFELSFVFARFKRVGIQIIAISTGVIIGFCFLSALNLPQNWLKVVIVVLMVLIFSTCAYKRKTQTKIFQGGLIGAAFLFKGLSNIVGGLPNEVEIVKKISVGQGFNRWFHLYLISIVIVCCLSMWLQVNIVTVKYRLRALSKARLESQIYGKKKEDVSDPDKDESILEEDLEAGDPDQVEGSALIVGIEKSQNVQIDSFAPKDTEQFEVKPEPVAKPSKKEKAKKEKPPPPPKKEKPKKEPKVKKVKSPPKIKEKPVPAPPAPKVEAPPPAPPAPPKLAPPPPPPKLAPPPPAPKIEAPAPPKSKPAPDIQIERTESTVPGAFDPNADPTQMSLPEQLRWMKQKNALAQEKRAAEAAGTKKAAGGEDDFDIDADTTKMSLPQQLQWNKKKMAYLQKQKDEAAKATPSEATKATDFDPNADPSKMSLPEQLAWNKKKIEYNNKKKEEQKKAQPSKPQDDKFDLNADTSKMSLPQQLQWNKQKMAFLAKQKEEQKMSSKEVKVVEEDDFDPNADPKTMTLAQQLAWNKKKIAWLASSRTSTVEQLEVLDDGPFDPAADTSSMSAAKLTMWKKQRISYLYDQKRISQAAANSVASEQLGADGKPANAMQSALQKNLFKQVQARQRKGGAFGDGSSDSENERSESVW